MHVFNKKSKELLKPQISQNLTRKFLIVSRNVQLLMILAYDLFCVLHCSFLTSCSTFADFIVIAKTSTNNWTVYTFWNYSWNQSFWLRIPTTILGSACLNFLRVFLIFSYRQVSYHLCTCIWKCIILEGSVLTARVFGVGFYQCVYIQTLIYCFVEFWEEKTRYSTFNYLKLWILSSNQLLWTYWSWLEILKIVKTLTWYVWARPIANCYLFIFLFE